MDILIAYSKQFAECNDSFYNTRENLKRIYGDEYIKNLLKVQYFFKTQFYDNYTLLMESIYNKNIDKDANYKIEKLLNKYKIVIRKLENIYNFYITHTSTTQITKTR